MRDELVRKVATLGSLSDAARWARSAIGAKNTLAAPDARLVRLAFELRLSALKGGVPRPEEL